MAVASFGAAGSGGSATASGLGSGLTASAGAAGATGCAGAAGAAGLGGALPSTISVDFRGRPLLNLVTGFVLN